MLSCATLAITEKNLFNQPESRDRLFEGDRIDYHAEIPGSNQTKPFSLSVPFLPGTELIEVGSEIEASFTPLAGVIIKK